MSNPARTILLLAICLFTIANHAVAQKFSIEDLRSKRLAVVKISGYEPELTEGAIVGHLVKQDVEVLERSDIQAVLEEHKLTMSGLIDESKAVEIGNLVGAQYAISGSVTKPSETNRANLRDNTWSTFSVTFTGKIIDIATGKVIYANSVSANRGFPDRAVRDAVAKFFKFK
jgi:curli biogenesis system outer membrane secretion channel CsgG